MDNATFLRISQLNQGNKYNAVLDLFPVSDTIKPFHLPFYADGKTISGIMPNTTDFTAQRSGPTLISLARHLDKMVIYATNLLENG